jgi:hypothetical protein
MCPQLGCFEDTPAALMWHHSNHVFLCLPPWYVYITIAPVPTLWDYARDQMQWHWLWLRTDNAASCAFWSHRMLGLVLGEDYVVLSICTSSWVVAFNSVLYTSHCEEVSTLGYVKGVMLITKHAAALFVCTEFSSIRKQYSYLIHFSYA